MSHPQRFLFRHSTRKIFEHRRNVLPVEICRRSARSKRKMCRGAREPCFLDEFFWLHDDYNSLHRIKRVPREAPRGLPERAFLIAAASGGPQPLPTKASTRGCRSSSQINATLDACWRLRRQELAVRARFQNRC